MNDTNHTPGPWHISSIGGDKYVATENVQICDMIRNGRDAEHLRENNANAQLISAAPDLLSACQAAHQMFCDSMFIWGKDDDKKVGHMTKAIYQAIVKATGGVE